MMADSTCKIHSRLWCASEGFVAWHFRIPIEVIGDPLWLVMAGYRFRTSELLEEVAGAHLVAVASQEAPAQANVRGERWLRGAVPASADRDSVANIARPLALDIRMAECSRECDRTPIWEMIGEHAYAVSNMMNRRMVGAFSEELSKMQQRRSIFLSMARCQLCRVM